MQFWQCPIHSVKLLQDVSTFLEQLSCAEIESAPVVSVQWPGALPDFVDGEDVDLPISKRVGHLADAQRQLVTALHPHEIRAVCHYPAGGGLGWHTNSRWPGWRVYVPRLFGSGVSGTALPARRIPDRNGYANLFYVGPGAWHAVYAETARLSAGLRFLDDDPVIATLLTHAERC